MEGIKSVRAHLDGDGLELRGLSNCTLVKVQPTHPLSQETGDDADGSPCLPVSLSRPLCLVLGVEHLRRNAGGC